MPFFLFYNLMLILVAGLVAGIISKKLGIPMVIGYLVVGGLIGSCEVLVSPPHLPHGPVQGLSVEGVASLEEGGSSKAKINEVVGSEEFQSQAISELAHLGALFLLFSIGIHFAPSQIFLMRRFIFFGGPLQMIGVILPITVIAWWWSENWQIGLFLGCAAAISSTVLVFKSLEEYGQATSPFGLRAVAILLFQDMAVAPILLLLPLLGSFGTVGIAPALMMLFWKATFFVVLIGGIRFLFTRRGIHFFGQLQSVELMVLFTVVLLFGVCLVARHLELPSALGALAAGVALSENRLTHQISALTVPFRETFSAIFFVSLGALFDIRVLIDHPVPTFALLGGMLALKTVAGAVAFRMLGLSKTASVAMGLGISQLGELSFIVLQEGTFRQEHPVFYQQMLFVALLSLILTPLFLRLALRLVRRNAFADNFDSRREMLLPHGVGKRSALVIGMGPMGSRIASFLETAGIDICLVDRNPVNLQPYAQEGFRTVCGDATEHSTLKKSQLEHAKLVVITIPDDTLTPEVVQAVRTIHPDCSIVARCRYSANIRRLERAGADMVICEESTAGEELVSALEPLL